MTSRAEAVALRAADSWYYAVFAALNAACAIFMMPRGILASRLVVDHRNRRPRALSFEMAFLRFFDELRHSALGLHLAVANIHRRP